MTAERAIDAIRRWQDACKAAFEAEATEVHPLVRLAARAYADHRCQIAAAAIVEYGGPIELDGIIYNGQMDVLGDPIYARNRKERA